MGRALPERDGAAAGNIWPALRVLPPVGLARSLRPWLVVHCPPTRGVTFHPFTLLTTLRTSRQSQSLPD
ncbi:hypothetical protein PspLS_06489 [Pyricularia sp. CBS 133598]|nr:hypothetical protein PspLS_06489 [Pyricularia sp. CBS 133598]